MGFLDRKLVALSLLAGCSFAPQLDGIYACGADGSCPPALHCNVDRRCVAVLADLSSVELAGADLSFLDLASVEAAAVDSSSNDLAITDLAHVDLSHVDLSHVDLSQVVSVDLACARKTCSAAQCGGPPDGCGGKLSCGGCTHKLVCSATYVCVSGP